MHHHPAGAAHAIGKALQHTRQHLCSRIDALAGASDAAFAAGWDGLVAATEAAFRHEESVMELVDYAGLAAHRAENALTLSALHHATPGVEAGELDDGRAARHRVVASLRQLHGAAGRPPARAWREARQTLSGAHHAAACAMWWTNEP